MISLLSNFNCGGFLADTIVNSTQLPKINPFQFGSNEYWMCEALRFSMKAIGITSPNPPVGCILVRNNQEIARGHTQPYGGWHAERTAIMSLPENHDFSDVTAFVTLEPCTHTGRQPPCANFLVEKKFKKIVIAALDPNAQVAGKGLQKLRAAGIEIEVGVLKSEVQAWLMPFLYQIQKNKIFIAGKWAQSLDGKLADHTGGWRWITGPEARAHTHWLRQKYDAIVVGAGTALNDFPMLDVRDCAAPIQSQPLRILFDPKGRILNASEANQKKLFERTLNPNQPNFIFILQNTLNNSDSKTLNQLKNEGNVTFLAGDPELSPALGFIETLNAFDFKSYRGGRPLQSILVEGGPSLLSQLIENDSLDVMHTFIAPFFMGPSPHGIASKSTDSWQLNAFPRVLSQVQRNKLLTQSHWGNDTFLELMPIDRAELVFQNCTF